MELKEGLFAGIVAGIVVAVFLSLNLASPEHTLENFTVQKAVTSIVIWSIILGVGGILGSLVDSTLKRDSWNTMSVSMALYTYIFYLAANETVGVPTGMKPNSFPILEMIVSGLSAAFGYNHLLRRGTPIERPGKIVKQENLFEFSPINTEVGLPPKTLECYRLVKLAGGTALMTDSPMKVRADHQFLTEVFFDEMTLVQKLLNPNFIFGIPGIKIFEFPQKVKSAIKEAMSKYDSYYVIQARTLNRFPETEFYGGLFSSDKEILAETLNEGELIKALLQARVYYINLRGDRITLVASSKDRHEMLMKALQLLEKTLDGKAFRIQAAEAELPKQAPAPKVTPAPEAVVHKESMVKEMVNAVKPPKQPAPKLPESSVVQRLISQHAPKSIRQQYSGEQPLTTDRPALHSVMAREKEKGMFPPRPAPKPAEKKDDVSKMIWSGKPELKKEAYPVIKPIPLRKKTEISRT